VAHDGVEHRVHQLGVDEVAFGLDHFGDGCVGAGYGFISSVRHPVQDDVDADGVAVR
jgi:hypothetical protein